MSSSEEQKLRTQLASLQMQLASSVASKALLTERAQQAEQMVSMLQSDHTAEAVAQLIIKHMERNHQTLAVHMLNLIQTTAVSLTSGLEGSDEEIRALVNTVCAGLTRALETIQQVRLRENAEQVAAKKANINQPEVD
jgi:hypothetical protein